MVTGSVASIFYGEPRMTHDVDLVLALAESDIDKLGEFFPESEFYLPPSDVLRIEKARANRGHFNIIHFDTAFKADIYLTGSDELLLWGIRRRRKFQIENIEFWLAPPEYVIVKKLHYWDESGHKKHLDDIIAMLKVQGENIVVETINAKLNSDKLKKKFKELCEYDLNPYCRKKFCDYFDFSLDTVRKDDNLHFCESLNVAVVVALSRCVIDGAEREKIFMVLKNERKKSINNFLK